jgi:hypothetical protein
MRCSDAVLSIHGAFVASLQHNVAPSHRLFQLRAHPVSGCGLADRKVRRVGGVRVLCCGAVLSFYVALVASLQCTWPPPTGGSAMCHPAVWVRPG